jgi:hypothetical protein
MSREHIQLVELFGPLLCEIAGVPAAAYKWQASVERVVQDRRPDDQNFRDERIETTIELKLVFKYEQADALLPKLSELAYRHQAK